MNRNKLKVCLVDDNKSFREALKYFIEINTDWEIVNEFHSGVDFIEQFNKVVLPDVVFIDYQMPGIDGILTAEQILYDCRFINFIAVTMYTNKLFLEELIGSGFKGCIHKKDVHTQLIPAVETVLKGSVYFVDMKTLPETPGK